MSELYGSDMATVSTGTLVFAGQLNFSYNMSDVSRNCTRYDGTMAYGALPKSVRVKSDDPDEDVDPSAWSEFGYSLGELTRASSVMN